MKNPSVPMKPSSRLAALLLAATGASCILHVEGSGNADCSLPSGTSREEHAHLETTSVGTATVPRADAAPSAEEGLSFAVETFTLPNGLTVVLHEDHSLPKVVVNTWFHVGSKDEKEGRTGFAHLFEHLMFMGTARVPGNQYDVVMETGGGWNNASTGNDRTNYFCEGPSSLLPTLLWLEADRFAELANNMTQEKLDAQRSVVRNERRQTTENTPYGISRLLLPKTLYPEGHPYHHSIIGSHEDLEAGTLADVVEFFRTYYVPGNATMVVAGDFDRQATRALIEKLLGSVPPGPKPEHRTAAPVTLEREARIVATDRVEFPRLWLAWHSPSHRTPGDGELDLVADTLAGSASSRLEERLVETGLALFVAAMQSSGELGSSFQIIAQGAPGSDLETIREEILAVVDQFLAEGPTADELERAKVGAEAGFLRQLEDVGRRADLINSYRRAWGISDGFQRDLDRWMRPTHRDVLAVARNVLRAPCVDMRILPEAAIPPTTVLDERPENFPLSPFTPPPATTFTLSNGIAVHAVARPGTGLFAGRLVLTGGESLIDAPRAGLASLAGEMMNCGAGELDRGQFSDAAGAIGAAINAGAGRNAFTVSADGLASRFDETLDLLGDLVRRPRLTEEDFAREKSLALSGIQARAEQVRAVGLLVVRALAFGRDDVRGRPLDGFVSTVEPLTLDDVRGALEHLVHPQRATFVFAGDFEIDALRAALEARFGDWKSLLPVNSAATAPLEALAEARVAIVDRADAPQTMIYLMRPVATLEGAERVVRDCVLTVLGGSFSSRLNMNLREEKGWTYGASCGISQSGNQQFFYAASEVFTANTTDALAEFRMEFEKMASAGLDPADLGKGRESMRTDLVQTAGTTAGIAGNLAQHLTRGRPIDATARDLAALDAVTLEQVNTLAASGLFEWSGLNVILVGDRAAISEQLTAAGFPAPIVVDAEGKIVE